MRNDRAPCRGNRWHFIFSQEQSCSADEVRSHLGWCCPGVWRGYNPLACRSENRLGYSSCQGIVVRSDSDRCAPTRCMGITPCGPIIVSEVESHSRSATLAKYEKHQRTKQGSIGDWLCRWGSVSPTGSSPSSSASTLRIGRLCGGATGLSSCAGIAICVAT
ncbi:hypothetical protein C8Q70DRAFT_332943 [Cubamyces menziesii]|nr:hypothetical protein C8Q70DRAFT_332943 [Cubamyces menziesii]